MRKSLFAGVAGMVILSGWTQAQAQTAPPANTAPTSPSTAVQELVVTAEKRQEKAFDVPNAITVVSGQQVDSLRMQDARNLIALVPTAFMQEINAGTARDINIRGIGTPNLFAEPGVALYVDDIYSNGFISYPTQLYDIDRMEVLSGPQGGLYGRNAVGGAVNIISHDPTADYGAYVRASYGTYDRYEFEAMANIPLGDQAGLRIVGWGTSQTKGEFFNPDTGDYFDANNSAGVRAVLKVTPVQALAIRIVAETEDANTPGTDLYFPTAGETPTTIDRDTQPSNHYDNSRISAEANLATSVGTFTLIGGLRNYVLTGIEDTDLSDIAASKIVTNRKNWVHGDYVEGRWLSPDIGPLSVLAGFTYLRDTASGVVFSDLAGTAAAIGAPAALEIINFERVSSWAGFVEATVRLTSTLSLIGNARYTDDQHFENFVFSTTPSLVTVFAPQALTTTRTFTNFSPGGTLAWSPTETWRLYAKVQTGFRAGGFNFNVGSIADLPYNPEHSINYEVGARHNFGGLATLGGDAFLLEQHDVLVPQFDFTVPGPVAGFLANGGTARTYGVEVIGALHPMRGLDINANAGWLDAKFTSGTTAFTGSVIGNQLPASRPFTGTITADYRQPIATDVDFVFDGAYIHRSAGWFDVANSVRADAEDLVNLRAGFDLKYHQHDLLVTGFVQNALDNQYIIAFGGFRPPDATAVETAPGRTFGIEVKASF